jgi:hypothetical protein
MMRQSAGSRIVSDKPAAVAAISIVNGWSTTAGSLSYFIKPFNGVADGNASAFDEERDLPTGDRCDTYSLLMHSYLSVLR